MTKYKSSLTHLFQRREFKYPTCLNLRKFILFTVRSKIITTKEKIIAAIDKIPEKKLDTLYKLIQDFKVEEANGDKSNQKLMARLRQIRIAASPDFSTNVGLFN